jgi:phosphatidylglycerol:prolipoprotein diacylglycerol transferase
MFQSLPFGPLSIPTAPILAMLAAVLGLEAAGRFGRRFRLAPDDVWNTGLLALLAGLIVARLWNVLQFWDIYSAEPLLIVSLRPGGFALWPGVAAALVAAYANLLRRALSPVKMAAAYTVGLLAAASVLNVSAFLTGAVVGLPTGLPWAANYFGQMVHPVGLYRALGMILVLAWVWLTADGAQPGRTVLKAVFGFSLVHLAADAFVSEPAVLGNLRRSQLVALATALLSALLLARPGKAGDQYSVEEVSSDQLPVTSDQ